MEQREDDQPILFSIFVVSRLYHSVSSFVHIHTVYLPHNTGIHREEHRLTLCPLRLILLHVKNIFIE